MRILGIDPGYERLGLAVVDTTGSGSETLVHSECFQTPATLPFPDRLASIGAHLQALLDEYAPAHVALENVYFNTNQKTAMDVAAVRGLILYLARATSREVFEYTPPQIKSAVAGTGRGTKREVTTMLHHLIRIDKTIRFDDEYDAIAVALTHSAIHR